ncbi:carbohydrate-binding domain-containing protein [Belnapia rosea]|uniref:Ca-dependent carbohydrate-binding module xylan-binding n=1 Tax=Belnapia rosea TaxID=938405 RepID=A0A1G6M7J7_9PROT|nr:carbohydrate-binding domain-containing protein [Belnapia rosea]SDC51317.1 Ca-dependent carbohydrate-binding module xylan-binding [Belnapia rosea]
MASDTLLLKVSETVYGAPAQFTVSVDGKQVGSTYQTTAIHGWKSDTVTLTGDWDKGEHTVQIKYLNDFRDAGGDRNLFLDSAIYDGVAVPGARLNMWSPYDPNTFKVTDTTALAPATSVPPPTTTTPPPTTTTPPPTTTTPPPSTTEPPPSTTAPTATTDTLVLKVSATVYGAAAQFTVSVDGVQVGGTYQTTAMHGWKSDTVTLKGNWDSGDHSVSIKFLNDFKDAGGDRNLYLDSATYNGVAVPNAKLDMWSAYDPHVFKIVDTTALTTTPPPPTSTPSTGTETPPPTTTTPSTGTETPPPTTTTPSTGTETPPPTTTTPSTGTETPPPTTTPSTGTETPPPTTSTPSTGTETPPPTTTTPSTGTDTAPTTGAPDHLTLRMSEQAYNNIHAQFTVTVDGKQIGGTYTTTANHANKASETFDIAGDWGPGTHQVNVHFTNDAYGGWSGADRNLYLDGARYNGTEIMGVAKAITGGTTNSDANFTFTEAAATAPPPVTTTPTPTPGTTVNHDGLTDLNVLIRGQSNAMLLDQYGGDDVLKAELQKALPGVRINILDGDNKTEFSATAFTTWDTDGQQQKMHDYLNALPADIKDNETITVWMHNEYDQKISGLTTAQWKQEVQTDANGIRDILDDQGAASTPYLFVPIRYPYGGSFPAIRQGMDELSSDPQFHAELSWAAFGSNITMAGGPEAGSNGSHMTSADAATIGRDLAAPVLDLYQSIA